jgi:TPR repeat protein
MQDADELYYQALQFDLRWGRAVGEANTLLEKQCMDMLHRVLGVDPHHVKAQSMLGFMYGHHVDPACKGANADATKAVYWCQKAAQQGYAEGQFNLGEHFRTGNGVSKDSVKAVYWTRKAADQGYERAQFNLGLMYKSGEGVEQDAVQAVHWWLKAADQGFAIAQCDLGLMYRRGEGVEQDAVQAVHWYRKATVQGCAQAQYRLGFMYEGGEGVEQDAVQAVHWYRKAAVQGGATAQFSLGVIYLNGEGVLRDWHEAGLWLQKAVDQGHTQAHFFLGHLKEHQDDYQAAIVHYRAARAADCSEEVHVRIRRCVEAAVRAKQQEQQQRATAVRADETVAEDTEELFNESTRLLLRAGRAAGEAKIGLHRQHVDMLRRVLEVDPHHVVAQCDLGSAYINGKGAEKNDMKALRWYQKSAEQGYAIAQSTLGDMYRRGKGVMGCRAGCSPGGALVSEGSSAGG